MGELQDMTSRVWRSIDGEMQAVGRDLPQPFLADYSDREWKEGTTRLRSLLKEVRGNYYLRGSTNQLREQALVGLTFSDGGPQVAQTTYLDSDDPLDWHRLLQGRSVGETMTIKRDIPTLPSDHRLNSWSNQKKILRVRIEEVREAPFNIFPLPAESFDWSQAHRIIPWAILHTIQGIPWKMANSIVIKLEVQKEKESGTARKLLDGTIRLLHEMADLPLKVKGTIESGNEGSVYQHSSEGRCRYLNEIFRLAMNAKESIKPENYFKEVCRIFIQLFDDVLDELFKEYRSFCQNTEERISGEATLNLNSAWCKTRHGSLQGQALFLQQLKNMTAVQFLLKRRRQQAKDLLEQIHHVQDGLQLLINPGSHDETRLESSNPDFDSWRKDETLRRYRTDREKLAAMRQEEQRRPFHLTLLSDRAQQEAPISYLLFEGEADEIAQRLENLRFAPHAMSRSLPELPAKAKALLEDFFLAMGRKASTEKELAEYDREGFVPRELLSQFDRFRLETDDRHRSVPREVYNDMLKEPMPLRNGSTDQDPKQLQHRWVRLRTLLVRLYDALLDEMPRYGGLLQDFLFLIDKEERQLFALPILHLYLHQLLESNLKDHLQAWKQACSEPDELASSTEVERLLDSCYGCLEVNAWLLQSERECIRAYWSAYHNCAMELHSDLNKNPNLRCALRLFLRFGLPYDEPSFVAPDLLKKMRQACRAPITNPREENVEKGTILFADEMLLLMGDQRLPPNYDVEHEMKVEADQNLQRGDRDGRRKWRLQQLITWVGITISQQEDRLSKVLLRDGAADTEEEALKKSLSKLRRLAKDMESRKGEIQSAKVKQDFKLDEAIAREVAFLRLQVRHSSGREEVFTPFRISTALKNEALRTPAGVRKEILEFRRRDKNAFEMSLKGYSTKIRSSFAPLTILLPTLGSLGNCVRPRSSIDLGRVVFPIVMEHPDRAFDTVLQTFGTFRYESAKEQGHHQDPLSFLGRYLFLRWELLQKNDEARKKAAVSKKLSDRENFVEHFKLYLQSEGGRDLKSRSRELFDLFEEQLNMKGLD